MKPSVLRARLNDEPVVRYLLEEYYTNYCFMQGSVIDDWNHIDLHGSSLSDPNNIFEFDVKRNSSYRCNKDSFTFTFKNNQGELFPFKSNGLFVFIDELHCQLIVVTHEFIESLIHSKEPHKSLNNNSWYIYVPISELIKNKVSLINIPYKLMEHLSRNRNEDLYKF